MGIEGAVVIKTMSTISVGVMVTAAPRLTMEEANYVAAL